MRGRDSNTDRTQSSHSWIFVSHSSKDFEAVRKVRNALEERGHFPLLFFLKCMADESELGSLLRREIEARDFFLLCDSENARASRYVTEEVSFIKNLKGKVYETVDLNSNWEAQLKAIQALSRRATVYFSYSTEDSYAAGEIATALAQRDFKVETLHHTLGEGVDLQGADQRAVLESDLLEALSYGFVVVLLSASTFIQRESYQWLEMYMAQNLILRFSEDRPRLMPVILCDHEAVVREIKSTGLDLYHYVDVSQFEPRDKATHLTEVLLEAVRNL